MSAAKKSGRTTGSRTFDWSSAILRVRRSGSSVLQLRHPLGQAFRSDRSHTMTGRNQRYRGGYEKVRFNRRLPRCRGDPGGLPVGNTGPCTFHDSYTGFLCDCQSSIRCIHTNAAVEAEFTIKCVDSERYLRSGIPRWGAGRAM